MNKTNFEHLVVALVIQIVFRVLFGDWIIGAVFASGIFLGREHAQREYLIGNPVNLMGYEALDFWRWELDEILDLTSPVVGVWGVCLLVWLQSQHQLI